MRGIVVYNSQYKSNSYLNNINMYHNAISPVCKELTLVTTADIMPILDKNNQFLKSLDFALFLDKDICLAKILENSGIRVFNSALSIAICDNKAYTHSVLLNSGINMPTTYITPFTFKNMGYSDFDFLDKINFFPVVVKLPYGSLGQQVYFAKDKKELLDIAKSLSTEQFLIQKYLECNNTDTRVFVCGGKAICSMERHNDNDFRSNVELGGVCKKIDLDKEICKIAEKASKLLGLDFCGVDIIKSGGEFYLLEVNSNSMINGLAKVCGINPADALAKHILKEIKGVSQ